MKKRILFVFLALVLVVSLAAFAACAKEEEAPPVVEEVWKWPKTLDIMATGVGSAGYGHALAWSVPLSEDTGVKVRLVCIEVTPQKFRLMMQGRIFTTVLSLLDGNVRATTPEVADRDLGPCQWRILYPMSVVSMSWALRGDSEINSPYDVKGKKVAYVSPMGEPYKTLVRALLAWGNISDDEVTWIPVATAMGTFEVLRDGKVDVVFASSTTSAQWYELEAAPHGLKFMDLDPKKDPEGAARFEKAFPVTFSWGTISRGVPSSLGVKGMLIVAPYITMDLWDEELVYHVVKWLHENHDLYKGALPACEDMTIDNLMVLAETDFIPLHDGTVKYLKELGRWSDAHEARRQQNIDLLTKWEEAYQTAISMADDKGIVVSPESEEWLKLWAEYRDSLPYPPFKKFAGLD